MKEVVGNLGPTSTHCEITLNDDPVKSDSLVNLTSSNIWVPLIQEASLRIAKGSPEI